MSFVDVYQAELNNRDFWEVEHFVVRQVQRVNFNNRQGYYPIPDFVIPVFQRSRIMAVKFSNPLAKPHWRLGCYLKQSIPSPRAMNPDDFSDLSSWRVPLNAMQVFFPLTAVSVWQLRASIPYWHEEARLTIYRFTGAVNAPLINSLMEIQFQLTDISARI